MENANRMEEDFRLKISENSFTFAIVKGGREKKPFLVSFI
jgi:hypothetical protein